MRKSLPHSHFKHIQKACLLPAPRRGREREREEKDLSAVANLFLIAQLLYYGTRVTKKRGFKSFESLGASESIQRMLAPSALIYCQKEEEEKGKKNIGACSFFKTSSIVCSSKWDIIKLLCN